MIKLHRIFFKIPAVDFHSSTVASQSLHRYTSGQLYRPIYLLIFLSFCFSIATAQSVTVKFNVIANGQPLVLNDSSFTNAFNETYQVSRLKYYISNIALGGQGIFIHKDTPFLMEAGITDSITIIPKVAGDITHLEFTVGVDSALNCSGAQDGALDPLNGMFWTWNSGYIFFKMEGYSSSSKADLQRIEHHVGGYRYPNAVQRRIKLELPTTLAYKAGANRIITVTVDLDKYWKGVNDIRIADQALLMTPGGLAIKAADNFPGMFSIKSVQ